MISGYDYLVSSINEFIDNNNYILVDYVNNWAPKGSVSITLFYRESEEGSMLTKDFNY